MRARTLTVIFAAALAACGSSTPGAAAPPPSPDPAASPTTAGPAPSPAPAPAPSPSPSPSPAPAPPPPAPADRFVDLERLDSSAECDALAPKRIPDPVRIQADPVGGNACGAGTSEGTGHVGVEVGFTSPTRWQAFAPDGRAERQFAATGLLAPQPEGWQVVTLTGRNLFTGADVHTFFPDGTPRRTETPRPPFGSVNGATTAPHPLGGSIVALIGGGAGCDGRGALYRYDATGAQAGPPAQIDCGGPGLGGSTGGEALVVQSPGPGSMRLRWVRPDGSVAAQGTATGSYLGAAFEPMVPLLDGSLVVRSGDAYGQRFGHLAAAPDAPPAWLAARGGQTLRFTRGNKGYAFFPRPGQSSPDCTQVVELVGPSGRRCAKLTFRRDGNPCQTGSIDQGWDGTVVQQDGFGACGWRFWPGLLAGD